MDIQARKIAFIQEFLKIESEKVISSFEKLLKKENENLKPFSVSEFENRINQSLKDSDKNNLIENNYLLSEIEEWD